MIMSQDEPISLGNSQSEIREDEGCPCDKKQCVLGIASIAIGIGGFLLALAL